MVMAAWTSRGRREQLVGSVFEHSGDGLRHVEKSRLDKGGSI